MEDLDIIKQLMNSNHLEKEELQRARELFTSLFNSATERYFLKCSLTQTKKGLKN